MTLRFLGRESEWMLLPFMEMEKNRASGGRRRGRTNYDIYSENVQFHRTIRHQVSGNQLNLRVWSSEERIVLEIYFGTVSMEIM